MKVHLLYPNRDYSLRLTRTEREETLTADLGLDILLRTMAGRHKHLYEVCASALFDNLDNRAEILYRQAILSDCLRNPDVIRTLYHITEHTLEEKRKHLWGISSQYLSSVMSSSVGLLSLMVRMLRDVRGVADSCACSFHSEGMTALFSMLQAELSDAYFEEIEAHLRQLRFRNGVMMSAVLGKGNISVDYKLHSLVSNLKAKIKWHFAPMVSIHPRDDAGSADLSRRRDRAINLAANAVAQSAEHILGFCTALHTELAFYVGCINLFEALRAKGEPVCMPTPRDMTDQAHEFSGLYDICLSLSVPHRVVGNDGSMGARSLAVISGANQGGKSTFLRSVGQAQIMMQCGMFVAATGFESNIASAVFSHYKREEDASMRSGKLDEELSRMSGIIDEMKPHAVILFNESFASTNEREGSEIARQVTMALLDERVKVFFVTHMYDLSAGLLRLYGENALFLRANRKADGVRNFRLAEGEPLPASFGEDLYREVFGNEE